VWFSVLVAGCHAAAQERGDAPPGIDGAVADAGSQGPGDAARDGRSEAADAAIDGAIDGAIDAASDAASDAAPDAPTMAQTDDLVTTGLCVDDACTAIQSDVVAFEPRWHLWSDGETKRRWIKLPAGAVIDTSNLDYWQFPVGTKLWKEFTRDGVRVETRSLVRTGPSNGDWLFMGYEWNADETHAVARPDGKHNVHGTPHDIPSQETCRGCHANNTTPVLGFGAFQLDYHAGAGLLDLDGAIAAGWLSQPPPGAASPHLPLPGTATETMASTRLYQSTVGVVARTAPFEGATILAKPGDPDHSVIILRTTTPDLPHRMPALGIETVDPAGQAILRAWIRALP
jgi:hypothetical protein